MASTTVLASTILIALAVPVAASLIPSKEVWAKVRIPSIIPTTLAEKAPASPMIVPRVPPTDCPSLSKPCVRSVSVLCSSCHSLKPRGAEFPERLRLRIALSSSASSARFLASSSGETDCPRSSDTFSPASASCASVSFCSRASSDISATLSSHDWNSSDRIANCRSMAVRASSLFLSASLALPSSPRLRKRAISFSDCSITALRCCS